MFERGFLVRCMVWAVVVGGVPALAGAAPATPAAGLPTAVVTSDGGPASGSFDGVVEAVRQTLIAAQVPGTVVAVGVKPGDVVKAGQVLVRLDARAADQSAAAGDAQANAARATLDLATREFDRQKQLFQKQYISQAALDRAEAQYKAAQAQVAAQLAQAGAARTQSGFYVVKAPYNGVVADVPVNVGDMAMPGKPLVNFYDPTAMRVTATVPQSVLGPGLSLPAGKAVTLEVPGLAATDASLTPVRTQVLPAADATTHTVAIRLDLPTTGRGLAPGMFARVWLPVAAATRAGGADARLYVPASAIVRRAELVGVYVIGADGKPMLRQVRLGRASGDRVEILAGVGAGERVATDPQLAARMR